MSRGEGPRIEGECAPEFARIRDTFEANFRERGEIGAAVCVYKDGRKAVDLWGGIADPASGRAWHHDTIVAMMSVGKSMAALSVLMLVDRGLVDLDSPVAAYWPEFGQGGKAGITVRTLLQGKAGLLYADHAADGAAYDWDAMVRAFETQTPEWEPGTKAGYHSMSAGILFGEVVHRVDGRMISQFFDEEIAGPLGIDYRFGMKRADFARTATIIPNPDSVTFTQTRQPETKLGRAWRVRPQSDDHYNDPAYRTGVFPSSNGHGNARAIARVYAALGNGGEIDGVRLVSPMIVEEARTESWNGICEMTDRHFRYACGFFLSQPPLLPFGPNSKAFGHPGAGGAIGFADPEAKLSFSYSPNFMCGGAGVGDRCEALVHTLFA